MALPQKRRRGLRKIVVGDYNYYWKFERLDRKIGKVKVTIGLESQPHKRVILHGNNLHGVLMDHSGIERNYSFIKPNVIRKAIEFAINAGWTLELNNIELAIHVI